MAEGLALLAYCLAVTVIVETIGAFLLFRIRDKDALIDVALAQVATNPLVEAGTIGAFTFFPNAAIAIVAVLELAAFVAEALIYRAKGICARPWLVSAVLNAFSLIAGFITFAI